MWFLKVTRKEFLELLGKESATTIKTNELLSIQNLNRKRLAKGSILLVWEFEPKVNPPCLVITPDSELKDFLAWATTYLPSFKPFTAFFKTINLSLFKIYNSYSNSPNFNSYEDVCAGMVISEALTQIPLSANPNVITPTACKSTVSYCYIQAICRGISIEGIEEIIRRWKTVRSITNQPKRSLSVTEISILGRTLENLILERPLAKNRLGFEENLYKACKQIRENGKCSAEIWNEITSGNEKLNSIPDLIKGTIEDRIQIFNRAIQYLKSFNKISNAQSSFVCGYFASLIKPGSLEHFSLIKSQLSSFPTSLVWYGFLTGLNKNNMILAIFDNLGRRVLRDLMHNRELVSTPSSDISFDELHMRFSSGEVKYNFKKNYTNSLQVELVPNIFSIIRIIDKEVSKGEDKYKNEKFVSNFKELGHQINKLNEIYSILRTESQLDRPDIKTKGKAERTKHKQLTLL